MILAATILFLLVLAADLFIDYHKWLNEIPVNHTRKGLIRAACLLPSVVAFTLAAGGTVWIHFIVSMLLLIAWYGFLFDGLFNIFRGFNWWFLGTDDLDDAGTDDFFQSKKRWQVIAIKIFACLFTPFVYLLIFQHG